MRFYEFIAEHLSSDATQLASVQRNVNAINYIKNPTPRVKELAQ